MVTNPREDLYYKLMAMAMDESGDGMEELWWWNSFGELQMRSEDGSVFRRRLVSLLVLLPSRNILGLTWRRH